VRGTDSNLDAVLKAITQLRTVGFLEPTTVVMHPTNYETIRLSKATGGEYLLSDPLAAGQPTLAGARVILTTDIPLGTALVMNADELARVFARTPIQISWGTAGDQFQRNIISVIAEERLAFGVRRPSAAVSVTALN
jgi:HK97 family phage major capsid protein